MRSRTGERGVARWQKWHQTRYLVLLPITLVVVITVVDTQLPNEIHLGPLLIVAPALTASFGSSRLTAAIGALAVGGLLVLATIRTSVTTSDHMTQLVALILVSTLTVLFCRWRERNSAELRQVRTVADAAQRVVLRPLPDRMGTLRLAFAYEAAADQARIGGDLYAAVRTRHTTRLLVGDVRGKGLAAVDDAGLLLGAFRAAAHRELPLPNLQAELEEALWWALSQPGRGESEAGEAFITALLIDVPDEGAEVHVINSGHPAPLLMSSGRAALLAPRHYAPPLGVCPPPPAGADTVKVDTYPFAAGDLLLLYTDGTTEARDANGRFYPLTERITRLHAADDPSRLVALLRDDLMAHTSGSLDDDAALVCLKRDPVGAAAAVGSPDPSASGGAHLATTAEPSLPPRPLAGRCRPGR